MACRSDCTGDRDCPSTEFSSGTGLNEVTRLSVIRRLELLAAAEPAVRYRADGRTANGTAEVFLGVQAALRHGEGTKPTVAASYFRRVHDGGVPELNLGAPRNSFLLLASADVRGFHYDANAVFNEQVESGVRRAQFGQTLSISHPLSTRLSISGELWHFTQPFLHSHAVGNLWAVSYKARKNLVFDAGFDRGLTGTSTRWGSLSVSLTCCPENFDASCKGGVALYKYQDGIGAAMVIFGEENDGALLGAHTLETLGFALDPIP